MVSTDTIHTTSSQTCTTENIATADNNTELNALGAELRYFFSKTGNHLWLDTIISIPHERFTTQFE
jgi:hypothetical protein